MQNQRKMVFLSREEIKFRNDSFLDELCDIPRCSVTKAKLIDQLEAFGKRLSIVASTITLSMYNCQM